MTSNKSTMITKLGSEAAYREYMSRLARGRSKRQKDTIESLTRRIKVVAESEGVEVRIKVTRRGI